MSHTPCPSRAAVRDARRIVVKVGSSVLAPGGELDPSVVRALATALADLRDAGRRVVLVSSGAVASGYRALGLERMPVRIMPKQAAAAVGQPRLLRAYADAFAARGIEIGQVLLTLDDMQHRARFLNARHTLDLLLDRGVLPVVNENDSVSFDEIKLGDNDRLSAHVSDLIDADLLVLLTSVPGVGQGGPGGPVIGVLSDPASAQEHVSEAGSAEGTGGMRTKLEAATIAGAAGAATVIADGRDAGTLPRLLAGEPVGTLVPAPDASPAARKRWIGFAARPKGTIHIDDGARIALLERGASLLPGGVERVEGEFAGGEVVDIRASGTIVARGLSSYASIEINRIKGQRADQIVSRLGYCYSDEIVHRDDLIVLDQGPTDA